MKKQLFLLLGLGLLLATISAYAQSTSLKVNIPFNFLASESALPSGEYELSVPSVDEEFVAISSAAQTLSVFLANPDLSLKGSKPSPQSKLVFLRYHDQYFLSEIWMEGSTVGRQVPKSRRERQAEMAQNGTLDNVVILADLRPFSVVKALKVP